MPERGLDGSRTLAPMLNVRKSFAFVPEVAGRGLVLIGGRSDATLADRLLRLFTFSLIVFGLYLRCRGVLIGPTLALWNDESQWLVFLKTQPLTDLLIRPIAFMGLTKLLVAVFPPTEFVVRFLPWIGGLLAVVLSPALARRLCESSLSRVLVVAVIALHPTAIDLGRDFKPYSLGLALHMGVLILACNYVKRGRSRDLWSVLLVAMLGVLFAQDIIFVYPGLFITLAFVAWRQSRKRHLLAIAGSAAGTLAILLGLYFMIWSKLDQEGERDYWGGRYDVFYVEQPEQGSYLGWLGRKFGDVLAMPGMRREHWETVAQEVTSLSFNALVDRGLWIGLAVVGIVVLLRRRRFYELLLLLGTLLVLTAFNAAGRWPFGAFRTNLFLLAYVTPLAAVAFDFRRGQSTWLAPLPALALVVLPFFAFNKHFHAEKASFSAVSHFPEIIDHLLESQGSRYTGPQERLFMDTRTCADWRYYVRYHPRLSHRFSEIEHGRFSIKCGKSTRKQMQRAASVLERGERIWGIATGEKQSEELDQRLGHRLRTREARRFGERHVLLAAERR
jgi:hypothetical protein